jgi:hypothetical protein
MGQMVREAMIGLAVLPVLVALVLWARGAEAATGTPVCWTLAPFDDTLRVDVIQPVENANLFIVQDALWNGLVYIMRGGGTAVVRTNGQAADLTLNVYHETTFAGGNPVGSFHAHVDTATFTGKWGVLFMPTANADLPFYAGGSLVPRSCSEVAFTTGTPYLALE